MFLWHEEKLSERTLVAYQACTTPSPLPVSTFRRVFCSHDGSNLIAYATWIIQVAGQAEGNLVSLETSDYNNMATLLNLIKTFSKLCFQYIISIYVR